VTPFPNCQRVSTFREASFTKRGDLVRRRQPGQGRHLSGCPGARRNGGADPGAAVTRTGAQGGTNRGGDSPKPEHRSGEEEGPQARAWPRAPTAWSRVRFTSSQVSAPNVSSTRMGRPNWSQIAKQTGFKQALLRACSQARFTVPKEQGQRSPAGEMTAQFL
jgi:hypothetical protein